MKIIVISALLLMTTNVLFAGMDTKLVSSKNKLYGDLRYSLNSVDTASSTISTDNNASRLGLKGEFVGSNGITAFYHGQMGLNIDSNTTNTDVLTRRFFFGGIKGSYGKLQYGTVSTAYKLGGFKVDPFYDTMAGLGAGGRNFGMSRLTNGFVDNSLVYTSPMLGNFKLNFATYIDDSAADDHDFDLGLTYDQGPIHIAAQYMDQNPNALEAFRLRAQYKTKMYSVAINYENIDENGTAGDQGFFQLNGTYTLGDGYLAASFGDVSGKGTDPNGTNFTFGYFHQLLKYTQVYFLYSDTDYEAATTADRSAFSVGFSQKFAIGG